MSNNSLDSTFSPSPSIVTITPQSTAVVTLVTALSSENVETTTKLSGSASTSSRSLTCVPNAAEGRLCTDVQPLTRDGKTVAATLSSTVSTPVSSTRLPTLESHSASSAETARGSATSQSALNASGSTGNSNLSIAAVAGAAVGCFVAGALLAGLFFFLLFRGRSRRNKHAPPNAYVVSDNSTNGKEKGMPMVSISSISSFDFLPQQADDSEVRRRVSIVIDQIDQHVENFYTDRVIPLDDNLAADISRFETSQISQPLAACFAYTSSPTSLIKHCLAYHIFNLTLAPGRGTQPLLPTELAGMVASVYNRTLSSNTSKDTMIAFSTWKSLTRYLRPDLIRDAATSRSTTENSIRIASHFTNVFSPWSNPQFTSDHRNRHLTELVNNAVQTAVWLFGQADNFKFDWDSPLAPQDARHSVVVVPAIWKLTFSGTRLDGNGLCIVAPTVSRF